MKRSRLGCAAVVCAAAGGLLIGGPGLSTAFADPGDSPHGNGRVDTHRSHRDSSAPSLGGGQGNQRRPRIDRDASGRGGKARNRKARGAQLPDEKPSHSKPWHSKPWPSKPWPSKPWPSKPWPSKLSDERLSDEKLSDEKESDQIVIVFDEKPLKESCDQCAEPNPDDPPRGGDGGVDVPPVKQPSFEDPQIAGRGVVDVPPETVPGLEPPQRPQPEVPAEPDVVDAGTGVAVPVGGRQVLPFPVVVAPPANVVPRVVVASARQGEPPPVVVVPPVNVVPPIVGAPPARPAGPPPGSAPRGGEAPPARPGEPAPGSAPRGQVPSGTGASAGVPAGASGPYRAGYNQYLRTAEVSQVAVVAVPGLAGILLLTASGGFVGYRQAKAGQVVRADGIDRFLQ